MIYIPTSKAAWAMIGTYFIIAIILHFSFDIIESGSADLYGSHAEKGNYFLMPTLWLIYGALVYFVGNKVNIKKEYMTSGVLVTKTECIKIRINTYRFFYIPVQYWGIFSFCCGVIGFVLQILYRYG